METAAKNQRQSRGDDQSSSLQLGNPEALESFVEPPSNQTQKSSGIAPDLGPHTEAVTAEEFMRMSSKNQQEYDQKRKSANRKQITSPKIKVSVQAPTKITKVPALTNLQGSFKIQSPVRQQKKGQIEKVQPQQEPIYDYWQSHGDDAEDNELGQTQVMNVTAGKIPTAEQGRLEQGASEQLTWKLDKQPQTKTMNDPETSKTAFKSTIPPQNLLMFQQDHAEVEGNLCELDFGECEYCYYPMNEAIYKKYLYKSNKTKLSRAEVPAWLLNMQKTGVINKYFLSCSVVPVIACPLLSKGRDSQLPAYQRITKKKQTKETIGSKNLERQSFFQTPTKSKKVVNVMQHASVSSQFSNSNGSDVSSSHSSGTKRHQKQARKEGR